MKLERPGVFAYFDARKFLRDAQVAMKARRPSFTLEHLGKLVGLKSKGHVSLIFQGRKNIPDEKIPLFAKALDLDARESAFFAHLVRFTQAATHRERKLHLDRMVAAMRVADRKLVPAQYDLCRQWYHPVVHELLRVLEIRDEWEVLATALRPAITKEQAKDSVALLSEIGLVAKDPKGLLAPHGFRDHLRRGMEVRGRAGIPATRHRPGGRGIGRGSTRPEGHFPPDIEPGRVVLP
jgi:uncharacterized protein (TIGR02147 family)